jgi:hypothetical protein
VKSLTKGLINSSTLCTILIAITGFSNCQAQGLGLKVAFTASKEAFPLVTKGKSATLVNDDKGLEVTGIAVKALQQDLLLLTGVKSKVAQQLSDKGLSVVIGTVGHSKLIDQLATKNLIPVAKVKGKWETFCITTITDPNNARQKMLVIFGSDPRGTAFGVFELSKMLGVSPWVWWADVKPQFKPQLYISGKGNIIGPPSVKYRGFFINDEDWGMRPWAAKNMDKNLKDIGPNTYEKVFELMLRLKANYLWPAMHPGTKAFWYYDENPALAKKYNIVMGSSHHEPMLRNTEFEWNENFKGEYGKDHGAWRYDTNKDEIYRFFDDRVKTSVNNQAIYTVGMRATKDGSMEGPAENRGRIKLLEDVISDQRQILENRLQKPANQIPQVFCPYKEVLELYQAGLKVPDDVTITWVDDNHGYIRQLPNPKEQQRSGGGGVYYHFSYWGVPQDYLWLSSTSPVLTSFEMSKAYALHARNIWVFNVGDLKPAELELEFGMDLAWDVNAWPPEKAHAYAEQWAGRTFGKEFAKAIGRVKSKYYVLAAAGKPEQLNGTEFSPAAISSRLQAYQDLVKESKRIAELLPQRLQDAYFQLIAYPVEAACHMNEKIFYTKETDQLAALGDPKALEYYQKAKLAYQQIIQLGHKYNFEIAGGKWEGMMDDHPRGRDIFNMPPAPTLAATTKRTDSKLATKAYEYTLTAGQFSKLGNSDGKLKSITGLGSCGAGLTVLPLQIKTYTAKNLHLAPYAVYKLAVKKGKNQISIKCLPTFPLYAGLNLRYAVSINGAKPNFVNIAALAETVEWSKNVLRGYAEGQSIYTSDIDQDIVLRIYFPDPGLVLSSVSILTSVR